MKRLTFLVFAMTYIMAGMARSNMNETSQCPFLDGKSISILGDSYSTFIGWIPSGYAVWYNSASTKTDVHKVENTWWWKLCDKTHCTLLTNSSYSGSTICNTGYNGTDATKSSFITRMKKDMGQDRVLQAKPQVIFIFGGTNDSWANVPLGKPKYENWTSDDLYQTFPAVCYMFDYLKKWNPGTKIIFLSNTELKAAFYTGLQEACKHYDIDLIQLEKIGKQAGHPNIEGMEAIANQIISYLNKKK
jgi:lysophospholipase L1-like esterase